MTYRSAIPKHLPRMSTLGRTLKDSLKRPPIGLTQGGSSKRHGKGAEVAATNATIRQER